MSNKKPDEKEMFNSIVNNAFGFIDKSIEMIEQPQYAVLLFFTGVELFFKARLFYEHWAFVLDNVNNEKSSLENLKKGEAFTIAFEKARKLMIKLFQENLPKDFNNAFENLRKERNNLVHFPIKDLEFEKQTFKKIQFKSWYDLKQLLNNYWANIFIDFEQKIQEIDSKIITNNEYLIETEKRLLTEFPDRYKNNDCIVCQKKCLYESKKFFEGQIRLISCDICNQEFCEIDLKFFFNNTELENHLLSQIKLPENKKMVSSCLCEPISHSSNGMFFINTDNNNCKIIDNITLNFIGEASDDSLEYDSDHIGVTFDIDFIIDLNNETFEIVKAKKISY